MTLPFRLFIALAAFFLSWPCSVPAITLHVTDDTDLQIRASPNTNTRDHSRHAERESDDDSHNRDTISVRHSRHGGRAIGLVKFDMSILPPDSQIERATLRMWISELHQPGVLNFHEVLEDWQEDNLRTKHLPPISPMFHSVPIDTLNEDEFLTLEVTTVVQGWLTYPATNFGLALTSEDPDSLHVEIDSKENRRTSHPMEIEVTLVPGIGPEGPQGEQGPKGDTGLQGPEGPSVQLLMLGKTCPTGEFLTGFDNLGNIICIPLPMVPSPNPPPVQDVNPGDVIITEFMADPLAVTDGVGEWFEIFNVRPDSVDISGWTIQEATGNTHTISTANPIVVKPGAFLVLGLNSDTEVNGGVSIQYQYSGITLNNGNDSIVLLDIAEEIIDQVSYGGAQFAVPTGASFNLDAGHLNGNDNDNGPFWCPSTTPIGVGANSDFGTPGLSNEHCP